MNVVLEKISKIGIVPVVKIGRAGGAGRDRHILFDTVFYRVGV